MFFDYKNIILLEFIREEKTWIFLVSINDDYLKFRFSINFKSDANIMELLDGILFHPEQLSDDTVLEYVEQFENNCNLIIEFNSISGEWFQQINKKLHKNESDARKSILEEFFMNDYFKTTFYNFKVISMLVNNKRIDFNLNKKINSMFNKILLYILNK